MEDQETLQTSNLDNDDRSQENDEDPIRKARREYAFYVETHEPDDPRIQYVQGYFKLANSRERVKKLVLRMLYSDKHGNPIMGGLQVKYLAYKNNNTITLLTFLLQSRLLKLPLWGADQNIKNIFKSIIKEAKITEEDMKKLREYDEKEFVEWYNNQPKKGHRK